MKLLFLKGAEHELCRFAFTRGVFSPSPPHSSKPAVFCFSSTLSFALFNSSSHLKRFYLLFPPLYIMSPEENCKSPPLFLLRAAPPPLTSLQPPPSLLGLPTLLLFCSLLHPLTLFPSLYLCLDVTHTHTDTHFSHSFSVFVLTFSSGWSAEQRNGGEKKRGPVLLQWYWIHISV